VVDVLVGRPLQAPVAAQDVRENGRRAADCLEMHRVEWVESYLASDGTQMLCRFRAPDAESVRNAFRQVGESFAAIWSGAFDPGAGDRSPSVAVERRFDEPVTLSELRLLEDVCAWCWVTHRVRRMGLFVSPDGRRALYLYRAPDSESVRLGLRRAGISRASVWTLASVVGVERSPTESPPA